MLIIDATVLQPIRQRLFGAFDLFQLRFWNFLIEIIEKWNVVSTYKIDKDEYF